MKLQKILVVDDSPTELPMVIDILNRHKIPEIVTATNGLDAVAKAESEKPDLILMDVVMPGINGYQATRILSKNENTQHIPIVLCTTKGEETDKIWGMRQGAVGYLVKPYVAEDLLAKITDLLKVELADEH